MDRKTMIAELSDKVVEDVLTWDLCTLSEYTQKQKIRRINNLTDDELKREWRRMNLENEDWDVRNSHLLTSERIIKDGKEDFIV